MSTKKSCINLVRQKVGKAISQADMISEGDRIIVGISGGKDSAVLLEMLGMRRKIMKLNYELYAVHINITNVPYEIDIEYYTALCKRLDIELIIKDTETDLFQKPDKKPCFICSWARRRHLFNIAEQLNCNKLALGHHMDDAVETMLINMVFHGSISSMPPKLKMFEGKMELIRPLLLLRNDELAEFAKINKIPTEQKICPYGDDTQRAEARKMIKNFEKLNDKACFNMFYSMSKICHEYIPSNKMKR